MSQQRTYTIHCPQCGDQQDVTLYESVNVQTDPELKQRLLSNQLNRVTCPQCQSFFRVDKPLLYSDPERALLIYLIPLGAGKAEEGERIFAQLLKQLTGSLPEGVQAPTVHLVLNRSELIERIFLLEAGLNERIIEYIKHIIFSRNPERIPPTQKNLLFDAQDSSEEKLCFVIQDQRTQKLEGMLHYSRVAYDGLSEMFGRDDATPSLTDLFPGPHISARAIFLKDSEREEKPVRN